MHTIDFKKIGNKSKESSRRSVQAKIIQGVVNKLTLKLKAYTDDNDLIEEIKLRYITHIILTLIPYIHIFKYHICQSKQ